VAGAARQLFSYLAAGLFVSALFYALSLIFEGILARRKADWNYLREGIKEGIRS
jgi:hypothetical protein